MKTRKRPFSARVLTQWVDAYAREHDQPPARVRNWISHMVLGGALERAGFDGAGRKFSIKGGVALEMRLRHLARATKDLDLILLSDSDDPVEELEIALSKSYEGFSFRLRGEPFLMPTGASRLEISLDYLGRSWGTIQVDVGHTEARGTEVEMVEAIPLTQFGLEGPESLPCLSLPYHVAQKIHGMTLAAPPGRHSDRFRDLVDLLLLRELITDFEVVQRACREVFETRAKQPWPPFFIPPEHWIEPFAAMAGDLGLEPDLHQAAIEVRQFIAKIDSAAHWAATLPSLDGLTATTWYFAVGSDGKLHRVPAHIGEALFTGDPRPDAAEIRPQWQRDPGGVALIGVVLFLRGRKPAYVEGVSVGAFAMDADVRGTAVEFGPEVWNALAAELVRQARAPARALRALSVYLSRMQCTLPCVIARLAGNSTSQAHWWRIHWNPDWFLWDLHNSEPIRGKEP